MQRIRRVRPGERLSARHYNQIVDAINALLGMTSDGLVAIHKAGNNISFGLNVAALNARLPKPRALRFGKVTALYDRDGGGFTAGDDWISHVEANPCDSAGLGVDTSTTLCIKCSGETPFEGDFSQVGYRGKPEVGDVVGYLAGDHLEDVPGATDGSKIDGYIVNCSGGGTPWMEYMTA